MKELVQTRLEGSRPPSDAESAQPVNVPGDLPAVLRRLGMSRLRPAAVLVPLVERAQGLTVLLTQRAENLKHHAGQISFPGGRIEDQDAGPVEAALREAHEEIGLEPRFVEVTGFLDSYMTITGYLVTPVVGFVRPGFELRVDQLEVVDAFEVPLAHLMDPEQHRRRQHNIFERLVTVYEIRYEQRIIWGATAGMLINMYEKLFNIKININKK